MKPTIVEVTTRKQLKDYVHWQNQLYKGDPYYVPCIESDDVDTLCPEGNDAFQFCNAQSFLAYNDKGEIVGRVTGIVNTKANSHWHKNQVRFGWIDFINDIDVVKALIDAVAQWGKAQGLTQIVGPLGFSDMDKEGLLVEGFDRIAPFTTIYNYDYYGPLLEQVGLKKDIDWVQRYVEIPETVDKLYKAADMVEQRYGLRCVTGLSGKEMVERYGMKLFHSYNVTFAPLYEFTPLTDGQIETLLKSFGSLMDPDFLCILVDEKDEIAGFAVCVPSPSKAFQKNGGKILPFGWIPLLRALKGKNEVLEALMIGVHPDYQNKGAFAPMFRFIHKGCIKRGVKLMINNPQLEDNYRVMNLFAQYNPQFYMRRRSYIMDI